MTFPPEADSLVLLYSCFSQEFQDLWEKMHETLTIGKAFYKVNRYEVPEPEIVGNSHGFPNARDTCLFCP
jgi:hypothetical protein